MNNQHVLIAGGGPAGATLGAILAKEGVKVDIIERSLFPRPHVGESLQPAAFELLDFYLPGLVDQIAHEGFARKYGAVYRWGNDRKLWHVMFDDRLDNGFDGLTNQQIRDGDYAMSWQVNRARFDQILWSMPKKWVHRCTKKRRPCLQSWKETVSLACGFARVLRKQRCTRTSWWMPQAPIVYWDVHSAPPKS